jgi:hypothetical protein
MPLTVDTPLLLLEPADNVKLLKETEFPPLEVLLVVNNPMPVPARVSGNDGKPGSPLLLLLAVSDIP